ncbi:hypothetical protein R3P38DRAFT_2902103 [Favolaschia claudopus]|uniref:Secreted protein n=1 Tax=Favolaschia claudopus TaxID=2862362 RepID=A0AAW0CLI3_9AGAR
MSSYSELMHTRFLPFRAMSLLFSFSMALYSPLAFRSSDSSTAVKSLRYRPSKQLRTQAKDIGCILYDAKKKSSVEGRVMSLALPPYGMSWGLALRHHPLPPFLVLPPPR